MYLSFHVEESLKAEGKLALMFSFLMMYAFEGCKGKTADVTFYKF